MNTEKKYGTVVTIGRHPDNSIVFDHDQISDWHAQIVIEGDLHFLRDLNSKSGTFVNGGPIKMVQLKDGDVISFGSDASSFVFSLEDDEATAPADSAPSGANGIIDLTRTPRTQKIDWRKPEGASSSNIVPFPAPVKTGERDGVGNLAVPAPLKKQAPQPSPPVPLTPEDDHLGRSRSILSSLEFKVVCVVLLVAVIPLVHSWVLHRSAYQAGYDYGLREFANPPRDLSNAIVEKFAQPAAFKLNIPAADYDDFVRGIKDASFKTYSGRFHRAPHFETLPRTH